MLVYRWNYLKLNLYRLPELTSVRTLLLLA